MSLKETAALLAESRKIVNQSKEDDSYVLLNMILKIVTTMDNRMQKIEKGVNKIDELKTIITSVVARVGDLEKTVHDVKLKNSELEGSIEGISNVFDEVNNINKEYKAKLQNLSSKFIQLENATKFEIGKLRVENEKIEKLKSNILDLQCRSMKNNLIFSGLAYNKNENCEAKLRNFIYEELQIEHHIEFGNVHRFGKIGRNRAKPIVARFIYRRDLECVLQKAFRLRGKPFSINEQFPAEVEARRKKLYPVMKQAKQDGNQVSLIRDKLFINGEQFEITEHIDIDDQHRGHPNGGFRDIMMTPANTNGRPYKRQRSGSSPIETKTDDVDIIDLPGYEFRMKNRKKVSRNRSGGITLGYKLEHANKIKILTTDSQFVLWFKVSSDLLDIDDDIVFGIVYIPPEYTNYSSQDAYSQLENEYIIFSDNYKYVSLLGDFNGRTADDDDFVIIHNDKHTDNITDFIENKVYMLDELNIPKKRKSLDRVKNGYGKRLLDLCKGNNLFIVNGRIGDDRQYGKLTCRNSSIVDYCISSVELLKYFTNFHVLDFCTLYSDVHSPLQITLASTKQDVVNNQCLNTGTDTCNRPENIKKWDNDKIVDFQNGIDVEEIYALIEDINKVESNMDKNEMNLIVNNMCDLFLDSARATFGVTKTSGLKKYKNKPVKLDKECQLTVKTRQALIDND
ncbi:unnamed protein product [Mytilus edulis]|uniref:Endonuclease/exonuclease/phosphatase domain-containing protein n=1 Tax=Mytilus edulis TaxID=6550 RepID=A0A8S3V182_MYTED|nr:unnamed protein product [Mytilus edulis]